MLVDHLLFFFFVVVVDRRRSSHGIQSGAAEKGLREREQERQAFQHQVDASKRTPHDEVSPSNYTNSVSSLSIYRGILVKFSYTAD